MIDSKVRLTGNGYTITLTDSANELMRQPRGGGWGMAPVVNSWFEGAGDGARLRGTRRARRELTIPIKAFGEHTRQGVENQLRRLVRVIREPFRVHVDYDDGRSFWIDAVYESGASGTYSSNPNAYTDLPIVLSCPEPYWTSEAAQSFVVAPTPADEPFLPKLAGLHVGSAAALGEVLVENIGDVASRPTWTIHGPGTDLTIALNGEGFVLEHELLATDIVTIEFRDGGWVIEDQTGASLYEYLSPAPWFPEFPPGTSVVTAEMADTGTESYIQCVYPERREVVY